MRAFRIRTFLPQLVTALALSALAWPSTALAAEHYYRDFLSSRNSPPDQYVIEVPKQAALQGIYFRVEVDAKNRVESVDSLINGQATNRTVYVYAGAGRLPAEIKSYTQGALTGVTKYRRDAAGEVTHGDYLDAKGSRTGYWNENFFPDRSEGTEFAADGTAKSSWTEYYASDGVEVRRTSQSAGSTRSGDYQYDHTTGKATSHRVLNNGQLVYSETYTYDSNDDLTRVDKYSDANVWYSATLYENGLSQKTMYKFPAGGTKEIRYTYDAKRWISQGQQYINDALVCTFQYEHLPDGTIKQTLALGPDGSLWAEYPNVLVGEVDQTGHINGSPDVGTFHKTGNWW